MVERNVNRVVFFPGDGNADNFDRKRIKPGGFSVNRHPIGLGGGLKGFFNLLHGQERFVVVGDDADFIFGRFGLLDFFFLRRLFLFAFLGTFGLVFQGEAGFTKLGGIVLYPARGAVEFQFGEKFFERFHVRFSANQIFCLFLDRYLAMNRHQFFRKVGELFIVLEGLF